MEEQPPALPVKKHSRSSRCSSVGSDCVMLSSVGLQHQNYTYNDVFAEPTDCHAAECPIHYDPSQHPARFFSAGTPPPVPKKKLARTLSLPGTNLHPLSPLSPLSPLQTHPQNFDNPLYMLAPIPNTFFREDTGEFIGSHNPLLHLSQLSFDTPDEHLPFLFSRFDDQRPQATRRMLGLRVHQQTDEASSAHTIHQHVNVQDVIAHFQAGNTLREDSSKLQTQDLSHPLKSDCSAATPAGGGSTQLETAHVNINLPSVQSLLQKGLSVSVERDLPHATLEDFVQVNSSLQCTDCEDYDRQVCALLLQILLGSKNLYDIVPRRLTSDLGTSF
ncbi:hypothetical protein PBY51_024761 [Eleginops maclovinus]|uniref:Uncharacterized protein n=1 Tax=Eleginops maclovinus TaxID=56733 RepID=A0AAN7Y1N2_ELEMC|nr:hypothetical protein PBY51_024761 [Eleginops maclovinus]